MEAISVHLMLDLQGCPFDVLNDVDTLRESLRRAATIAKTTVLGETFHKFEPQGVSGLLLVSESHLSVHTWPEHGHAAVDVFTCGDKDAARRATDFLIEAFQAESHTIGRVDRGMLTMARPSMSPSHIEWGAPRAHPAAAAV